MHSLRPVRRRESPPVAIRSGRRDSRSFLRAGFAHEVAFADGYALPAENVVGRGCVKVEVGLREGEQEVLSGVISIIAAGGIAHVAAEKTIDLRDVDLLERGLCLGA